MFKPVVTLNGRSEDHIRQEKEGKKESISAKSYMLIVNKRRVIPCIVGNEPHYFQRISL